MKQKINGLKRMLNPKHIAVIGGSEAEVVTRQLQTFNSEVSIHCVNSRRKHINGIICLDSVNDLSIVPDAAFVAIPNQATLGVVKQLSQMGTGGIICYSSGFAELNEAGKDLQKQLVEAVGDTAIVGPNCYGLINYLDAIALWPDNFGGQQQQSGCALITQSGNLAISLSFQRHGLPLSHLITLGNQADVDITMVIHALLEDSRVKSIGIYLESILDISAFCDAANRAKQHNVPIVVIKSGASSSGAKLAQSHTSAMIAEDYLYDCLFQQSGIARAKHLDQFLETLKLVTCYGISDDNRFISMSCSGGEAALVADYTDNTALKLPHFSDNAETKLHSILGDRVHISNPLDYHTYIWGNYDALYQCFKAVATDNFKWVAIVLDYPTTATANLQDWKICEDAFIDALKHSDSCGIVVSTLSENMPSNIMQRLIENNIVPMQGLGECITAIEQAVFIAQSYANPPFNCLPSNQTISATSYLTEDQSKQLLSQYGLICPKGQLISANQLPNDIHYPVVVKAVGENLLHKTEMNAVHLNISNKAQLEQSIGSMGHLSQQFLVEAMQPKPIAEMVVNIKQQSHFGWSLTIGMGGVDIEIIKDISILLLPVTNEQIQSSIKKLVRFPLLNGYRNQPAVDLDMLTECIEQLCHCALDETNAISEIEINPLMVYSNSTCIVDALIQVHN